MPVAPEADPETRIQVQKVDLDGEGSTGWGWAGRHTEGS